jgi:hypothetical protein
MDQVKTHDAAAPSKHVALQRTSPNRPATPQRQSQLTVKGG